MAYTYVPFGQSLVDPDELEDHSLRDYNSVESGSQNETTSKDGWTTTTDTKSKSANRADVYEQQFTPVERNANAMIPALQASLGVGTSPLIDPSVQEEREKRMMRWNALGQTLKNLAVSFAPQTNGHTGAINRDTQNPYYLSSFKTLSSLQPTYNKAISNQNSALIKEQGDLAKALLNNTVKYDINDQNWIGKTNYGNAKFNNSANLQFAKDNTIETDDKRKNFHVGGVKTATLNKNRQGIEGIRMNPNHLSSSTPSGRQAENNQMLTPHYITVNDTVKDPKTGKMVSTKKVLGALQMSKGDMFDLLNAIEANAKQGNQSIDRWLKSSSYGKYQNNPQLNALAEELNTFYNKYAKTTANGETAIPSQANLSDKEMQRLWHLMSETVFSQYNDLPALQPYMNNAKFSYLDKNNQGHTVPWETYLNGKDFGGASSNHVFVKKNK